MLGETHSKLKKENGDQNKNTLGSIRAHNVVIACLPAGLEEMVLLILLQTTCNIAFTGLVSWISHPGIAACVTRVEDV